eukprot:scaffold31406_cov98-Amphora_coffeaeformis.AAC.1
MTRQSKKESKDRMERLDVSVAVVAVEGKKKRIMKLFVHMSAGRKTNRCNPMMTVGLRIKCKVILISTVVLVCTPTGLCDTGIVLSYPSTKESKRPERRVSFP